MRSRRREGEPEKRDQMVLTAVWSCGGRFSILCACRVRQSHSGTIMDATDLLQHQVGTAIRHPLVPHTQALAVSSRRVTVDRPPPLLVLHHTVCSTLPTTLHGVIHTWTPRSQVLSNGEGLARVGREEGRGDGRGCK